MDSFETDLFVIGGGSGGVRAARIKAGGVDGLIKTLADRNRGVAAK